ncbi:hypothetical protein PG997_009890 [Apiospora hydei]|uniref:Uncharacterized protein n=1 Tax=Apiospora hydei TaxID=1337664 RepID=A0ABR1VVH6_9PEZI
MVGTTLNEDKKYWPDEEREVEHLIFGANARKEGIPVDGHRSNGPICPSSIERHLRSTHKGFLVADTHTVGTGASGFTKFVAEQAAIVVALASQSEARANKSLMD